MSGDKWGDKEAAAQQRQTKTEYRIQSLRISKNPCIYRHREKSSPGVPGLNNYTSSDHGQKGFRLSNKMFRWLSFYMFLPGKVLSMSWFKKRKTQVERCLEQHLCQHLVTKVSTCTVTMSPKRA